MAKKKEREYMVDFVLRHLWHKTSRMYNQKANEYGVSISVGFIMLNIDKEGTPSTQLGPKMGMEPTSLSRTLKTMEEKGWIRREVDKNDKRKVLIFLTEEGLEKRRIARDVVLGFHERILSSIPKGKLNTFFDVAERIDVALDREMSNF
jgi:DNA-binding MarR family transcriptional regulator